MIEWEYITVVQDGKISYWPTAKWKAEPIELDKYGEQGWELVSFSPMTSAGTTLEIWYVFKRPKR